ncbi:GH39 family glycosyl hydrolase [Sediminibacterium goheungense]|uniref:Xylan 1,4-beta-xylosidase n=1 Tax=Sediminibacterium goheungense TaxID=1086393 RepID=A0A4R6IZV6_9BACT|nr:beta-xylosidase [Sediminibacterium goheungense]TDO28403.1 xylan 1,4-beta-xylosidase [Sediminibacterium goheungense]
MHTKIIRIILLSLLCIGSISAQQAVSITVDLSKVKGKMEPVWAWFGCDEPNYAYMKDGKKLLTELGKLKPSVPVYFRAHNMLTTGDGSASFKWGSTNAYTEDANGHPVYNWKIVDSIFDTYLARGIKPMAEVGFMPQALSVKPEPYRHNWKPGDPYGNIYTGWAYPPKDYQKWAALVFEWVKHSVERYGKEEVASWYWELWNEPDLAYWRGTRQEFFKLYDYTADAIKRALPTAKVGGVDGTGPLGRLSGYRLLEGFLQHVLRDTNYATGKIGAPLDFITFHAKGAPTLVKGHVRMNLGTQLRAVNNGFELVASFPELKHLPIIIGESDPEGCAACGMHTNPENAYRNGTMFSSYTAAAFARKYELADHYKVNFIGAVSWAFEFENQPWFHGFRDLATNGVDKPVLNVFRMYGKMGGKRVEVIGNMPYNYLLVRDSSVRKEADINALASYEKKTASVMVWNYHDDDLPAPASQVNISIKNIPARKATFTHYRIDDTHSNSYEVWKKMGSPQQPTEAQINVLEKAGQLALLEKPRVIKISNGIAEIQMELPRQGVSLVQISWK